MTGRPPLDPALPYEQQMRAWREELWTPAGAHGWRERRRDAARRLVAWREAGDDLLERTEARIARDELRIAPASRHKP